jgi:hypothetical protein
VEKELLKKWKERGKEEMEKSYAKKSVRKCGKHIFHDTKLHPKLLQYL